MKTHGPHHFPRSNSHCFRIPSRSRSFCIDPENRKQSERPEKGAQLWTKLKSSIPSLPWGLQYTTALESAAEKKNKLRADIRYRIHGHKCKNKNGCYISRAHRWHPPLLLRVLRYKFDKSRSADKYAVYRSNRPCVSLQQSRQPQIQVCFRFLPTPCHKRARISFFRKPRMYQVSSGATIFNLPRFFYMF